MGGCCPTYLDLGPLLFWSGVGAICGCALIVTGQALFLVTRGARIVARWRELLALPLLAVGCWSLGLTAVIGAVYWIYDHDRRYTPHVVAPVVAGHVDLALGVFSRLGMVTALVAVVLLILAWLALSRVPRSDPGGGSHA